MHPLVPAALVRAAPSGGVPTGVGRGADDTRPAHLAGIWEGSDPDESVRERLVRYAGVSDGEATEEVAAAAYRALARCPSRLVAATLEDALGVAERPNRPGTIDEWPNWSLGLPLTLEQLREDPRPARLAGVLRR